MLSLQPARQVDEQNQYHSDNQNLIASTEQQSGHASFWIRAIDDPIAAFTGVLAVATTLLFIFTYKLWRVTYDLSRDAKATGENQAGKMQESIAESARAATAMQDVAKSMAVNVRATISVLIGGARYQDGALRFEASPIILNTGQTPAHNLQFRVRAAILPFPLPDDFKFPLPAKTKGYNILGPGRDGSMLAVVADRVDDDKVEITKRGLDRSLYVWGTLSYRDVFGRLHRCTFAQQIYWTPTGEVDQNWNTPMGVRGWHLSKHNRTN